MNQKVLVTAGMEMGRKVIMVKLSIRNDILINQKYK